MFLMVLDDFALVLDILDAFEPCFEGMVSCYVCCVCGCVICFSFECFRWISAIDF